MTSWGPFEKRLNTKLKHAHPIERRNMQYEDHGFAGLIKMCVLALALALERALPVTGGSFIALACRGIREPLDPYLEP